MFSGIIEHKAKILYRDGGFFRIENTFDEPLKIGQSIAHDGACMTLTKIEDSFYEFFVMQESLTITNFCDTGEGDTFNVERSLKLGERIDGHMVTGHIDTVGKVILLEKQKDESLLFGVSYPTDFNNLVIRKGSITLNGVSLTVVEDGDGFLTVSLIPLTQEWTNLGTAKIGETINIEFDMIGKYMLKYQKNSLPGRA